MGIEKGDRVALWSPNIPEWVVGQLALAKVGAILVPIDPGAAPSDLRFMLEQSESRAIIMARGVEDEEYVEMILDVRDQVRHLENIFLIGRESHPEMILWTELVALGEDVDISSLEEREEGIRPEDPVAIMYTSGTTGIPKGVVLDHLGLLNKSLVSTKRQGLTPEDRLCLFFPLFHMFGNTCIALSGLLIGATVVMPCITFDPSKVLKAIHKERVYGRLRVSEHDHCPAGSSGVQEEAFCQREEGNSGWGTLSDGTHEKARARCGSVRHHRRIRDHRGVVVDHHDPPQ